MCFKIVLVTSDIMNGYTEAYLGNAGIKEMSTEDLICFEEECVDVKNFSFRHIFLRDSIEARGPCQLYLLNSPLKKTTEIGKLDEDQSNISGYLLGVLVNTCNFESFEEEQ